MRKGLVAIWVSYVKHDSQDFIEKIRSELKKVDPQIRLKTFAVVLEDEEEYVLLNGDRIDTLTDSIVRSSGVVYFFSKRFPASKYCCHELGWRLRRKDRKSFFLHIHQSCSEDDNYHSELSRAVVGFADDEKHQPSFPENYEPMPAIDQLERLLIDRSKDSIVDTAKDPLKVAKAISQYADDKLRTHLKYDLSSNFIRWLREGDGAALGKYIENELHQDGHHLNDFCTSIFDNCSIDYVHRFESMLVGYHASRPAPGQMDRDVIGVAAGFFSLTLFDRSYIESIRSFDENNVLLEIDVPVESADSGNAAAAIVVGIAQNNVPRLVLQNSTSLELSGLDVKDSISITELKPDREAVDDYEKAVRTKFARQLWRLVLGTAAPPDITRQHWQDLVGKIKRFKKLNRNMNIHFTVNTDEYGAIDDWCNLVHIAVEELNHWMNAGAEHTGAQESGIPTIILRTGNQHSELPWSSDHTQRIEHLKAILELCR